MRLTASFYVGRPAKLSGSLEFHGDDASLALGSFQDFDATVEVGAYGESYEPVAHVRPAFRGTAWARGVAEMAGAIAEGRPHRASAEQAAHVVDILEAAAASMADGGQTIYISPTLPTPPLRVPWDPPPIREDVAVQERVPELPVGVVPSEECHELPAASRTTTGPPRATS